MTHYGAGQFVADIYPTVGAFQANYLATDLTARGLINSTFGPELKHFPFYDDAKVLRDGIFELYVIISPTSFYFKFPAVRWCAVRISGLGANIQAALRHL